MKGGKGSVKGSGRGKGLGGRGRGGKGKGKGKGKGTDVKGRLLQAQSLAEALAPNGDSEIRRELEERDWAGSALAFALHTLAKTYSDRTSATTPAAPWLCELLHRRASTLRSRDMTKVMWALARLQWPLDVVSAAIGSLELRITQICDELDAMGASSVLWSLSKVGRDPSQMTDDVLPALQRRAAVLIRNLNNQDTANVLYALARLFAAPSSAGTHDETALDKKLLLLLVSRVRDNVAQLKPEELSSILWALSHISNTVPAISAGNAGHEVNAAARALAHRIADMAPSMGGRSIATAAYALANAGFADETDAITALAEAATASVQTGDMSEESLSNLCWAFAKLEHMHTRLFEALVVELEKRAAELTGQGLTNALWALASLGGAGADSSAVKALVRSAVQRAGQLSAHELASVWHSVATIGACDNEFCEQMSHVAAAMSSNAFSVHDACAIFVAHAKSKSPCRRIVLQRLETCVLEGMASLETQGTANLLWAFAKMSLRPRASLLCQLTERALSQARLFQPQELCNILWALATFDTEEHNAVLGQLVDELAAVANSMNERDTGNAVYALAKAGLACCTSLADTMSGAVHRNAGAMGAGTLAYTVWGLSKLGIGSKTLAKVLYARFRETLAEMHAQNCGLVAHCIASSNESVLPDSAIEPLLRHAITVVPDMNWQTCGHIDYLMRSRAQRHKAAADVLPKLRHELMQRSIEVCTDVSSARKQHTDATVRAASVCGASIASSVTHGARILLVEQRDSDLGQVLRKAGYTTTRWERFCRGKKAGSEWPKPHQYAAAVLCVPASAEWLHMCLHAVGSVLPTAAPLYCVAHVSDKSMLMACRSNACGSLFRFPAKELDLECNDACALRLERTPAIVQRAQLTDWQRCDEIEIRGARVERWTTFPGLFAGGGMDVMTAFLLDALADDELKGSSNVLDFCSGSGTIARHVLQRHPAANVTLLDADAIAICAARRNVPQARSFLLSDCWSTVPSDQCFDVILSNPPVHYGRVQDFTVLQKLLAGAACHLNAGGRLYLVVQSYVPAGLLQASSDLEVALHASNGRFSVFSARRVSQRGKKRKRRGHEQAQNETTPKKCTKKARSKKDMKEKKKKRDKEKSVKKEKKAKKWQQRTAAELELQLKIFYKRHNPSKINDAALISAHYREKQKKLNAKLRAQYGCDLESATSL